MVEMKLNEIVLQETNNNFTGYWFPTARNVGSLMIISFDGELKFGLFYCQRYFSPPRWCHLEPYLNASNRRKINADQRENRYLLHQKSLPDKFLYRQVSGSTVKFNFAHEKIVFFYQPKHTRYFCS